jgi:hypothetical protein
LIVPTVSDNPAEGEVTRLIIDKSSQTVENFEPDRYAAKHGVGHYFRVATSGQKGQLV